MKDILLVNPPLIQSILEHAGDDLDVVNLVIEDNLISSMNVGIVSISSYLVSRGFTVDIIDLYKDRGVEKLENQLKVEKYRFIGVSCVTGYSYLSSIQCFKAAKRIQPTIITIGGGAHLGPLGKTALGECPEIDIVARYEGEIVLEMILNGDKYADVGGIVYRENNNILENIIPSPLIDIDDLPILDFRLYPNYLDYMPFVEESRGCFAKCTYCVNCFLNQGKIRIKSPNRFLEDLDFTVGLYGKERNYIIESLSFGVNTKNTIAILNELKKFDISWGAEFRVDGPWGKYIDLMYESGCRSCDVGLESASPEILRLMRKTKNPESYIRSASKLLKKAMSFPEMNMSYNILFFLGESPHTMKQTVDFIFAHQSPRTVISVFPVFLFPGVPLWKDIDWFSRNYGSKIINTGYWGKTHICPVDLSSSVSFKDALVFSKMLQRMFLRGKSSEKKDLLAKNGNTDWTNLTEGEN